MEALEAFSLACNVMTVITFGLQTVSVCRQIQENGSSDVASDLTENAAKLKHASQDVQQALDLGTPMQPATEAESHSRMLIKDCLRCAEEIDKEVARIPPQGGGLLAAIQSTWRTSRSKSYLNRLESCLEDARRAMDTGISIQILQHCVESGKLSAMTYRSLCQEQKDFVIQYMHHNEALQAMVHSESELTRVHVSNTGDEVVSRVKGCVEGLGKQIATFYADHQGGIRRFATHQLNLGINLPVPVIPNLLRVNYKFAS